MVFTLYPAPSGPTSVHTETQTVVVSNGIFNVVPGTNTALTASFNVPYWLAVKVGADAEMTPRERLAASPYALKVADIGASYVRNGSAVQTGNFNVSGNGFIGGQLGIGTTSPIDSVHIVG